LGFERFQGIELLLISQILYQKQRNGLPINVFIEIEEMGFNSEVLALDGRAVSDVAHHFELFVIHQAIACIDPVGGDQFIGVFNV